ncbi:MAG: DUF4340 domain-containing protein [Oscillospiraceae bacterium]|nr:DUF4340 domain-containing protein [Oscillospiraceae bacterium]
MPRSRILILSVAALLLLGGLIALLALMGEPEPETTPETEEELFDIINFSFSEVRSVAFTSADFPPYTITRGGDTGELSVAASRALFPFNVNAVSYQFADAISAKKLKRVAENADDRTLEDYDLADPPVKWRVTLNDGSSVEIGLSGALLSRYVRVMDKNDVYIMDTRQAERLSRSPEDLYNVSFLPDYITPANDDNQTWYYFSRMAVTAQDTIELSFVGEIENGFLKMTLPVESDLNSYAAQQAFMIPLTTISPSEIIEINPVDLAQYGLDNPVRVELEDHEDWSGVLLVGKRDTENTGRYVMAEGINAVLLDRDGDYSFVDVSYHHLRSSMLWELIIIDDVSHVDCYLEGIHRLIKYEHSDDELRAWIDGKELEELNGRRIYSSILSVFINGSTDADIPSTPSDYKFVITLLDGTSRTMELYAINERQYLIVYNGENTGYIAYKSSVYDSILSKFELLDKGEDLPR